MTNKTILLGEVGSHAYGLAHEGSDHDYIGVFVAPTLEVAGLDWNVSRETLTNSAPGGETDDTTLHEVGKFLRLALKSNPTVTELLWLDTAAGCGWIETPPESTALIATRRSLLSEKYVRLAYRGYAFSQLAKFIANDRYKTKHARHCLRLIEQGTGALETGEIRVAVDNPQRYFDIADMTHDQVVDLLRGALDKFDAIPSTPLDEEPNRDAVASTLELLRRWYV